jgi:hypothetical protein
MDDYPRKFAFWYDGKIKYYLNKYPDCSNEERKKLAFKDWCDHTDRNNNMRRMKKRNNFGFFTLKK